MMALLRISLSRGANSADCSGIAVPRRSEGVAQIVAQALVIAGLDVTAMNHPAVDRIND
ncbi:MAG: hypothetical protein H0V34_10610 [Gammaproteobacteria bacterium]|nr:hypothetical protein [Gammaproteobacteria bacterium]